LKLFIASVIVLFGVVFFLFSLFPADMSVSRVLPVSAGADSAMRKIGDLSCWAAGIPSAGRLFMRAPTSSVPVI
jgi:hypothetical protein